MKTRLHSFNHLEIILDNEIGVLVALYSCQKLMYESVLVRDWISLQKQTAQTDQYVQTFLNYETERIKILKEQMPEIEGSTDFYQFTSQIPEPERTRINCRFREMKKLLLLSKTENDVFNTYITNARTIVAGMLETVLPARKNKIYSRKGNLVAANVENLVVNRSF
jgi:hypothetical protein